MSFTVGNVYAQMPSYFSGRNIDQAQACDRIRKTVLELSENYKMPLLQRTGPLVQLTPFVSGPYDNSLFVNSGDTALDINKLDSFFIYTQDSPPVVGQANSGFNLTFKTIDTLEILMRIPGQPTNWTRHENKIYIAMQPLLAYFAQLRYQVEHPFPNAGTGNAINDPILFPNSWQDIVEYLSCSRLASDFDLEDRRSRFYNMCYGDPKWQATGGTEGSPGLIFSRTSQEQRDQTTTTKSMQLKTRPVMR